MIYKHCLRCKRDYRNRRDFIKLTGFVGIQKLFRKDKPDSALELRNCSCGSTLAHIWKLEPKQKFSQLRRVL